ncbi:MAG: hypothetical protein HYV63_06080 [Candidatus Schekmanbacteria bacterium]|nr:hypothetical protein [Candidatus Schekmanbacteria bacterium]
MTRKPLNDHLRDYYQERSLRPEVLQRLLEVGSVGGDKSAGAAGRRRLDLRKRRPWVMMAGVAAVIGIALLVATIAGLGNRPKLARTVAREIASHHVKQLAVEIPARSFAELREKMAKLDFSMVASRRLMALRLVGGRYCSLRGQIAVQARLLDDAGGVYTLYQTRLTEELVGLDGAEAEIDGVRVQLWQEAGLQLGLAGSAD